MENKNIIIILVAVVIVLAVIAGAMFMQQSHAKEPTKLKITSESKQTEGGKLKIQLTDTNKTALSKEIVNITVTDKKGKTVVDDVVKTDAKGNARIDLHLKKGEYTVNVTYGGNDNYTTSNATQKLKIKEKVKKTVSIQSESSSSEDQSSQSSSEEYRPAVDSGGITREEADKYGWRYTTAHGGHYRGYGDHWDEKAGKYHD